MIRYILFDFDGTLVDTNDVIIASWQHTYRTYQGKEAPVAHITSCFGEPLLTTMEREFPGVPPAESAEVYRQFQQLHAADMVKLFPGVREMLEALTAAGYVLGIVTSRTRESAQRYMDLLDIGSFFYDMVTCDDTDVHKPDPAPLLLGLKKLGAPAEMSVMVGDSLFDIKCANGAAVRSVLVDWRMTGGEGPALDKVEGARADGTIATPADLLLLLQAWNLGED